jgi:hypothetical protein
MITADERPDQAGRIFRIALVVSLLVHLVVGFLVYESSADVRRTLARLNVHPKPEPTDEIVTLSTAFKIEKRPKAQPHPAPVRVAQRMPQRPLPQTVQERPVLPQPVTPVAVRTPVPKAPSRQKHELAKLDPAAPSAEPLVTVTAPSETLIPTAPPATPKPEKVVASLERPEAVTRPEPQRPPDRPAHAAHFSDAQLAQIQSDLAKTIVRARIENNPLSNVSRPVAVPAAYHRSAIDFAALAGSMREAQGLCDPIRSWQDGGWDYYYAMCTIEEPDGSVARKAMPWPVRWRPANDPWNGYNRIGTGPMPLPPPGWQPSGRVDPDFIPYLRKNGYPI